MATSKLTKLASELSASKYQARTVQSHKWLLQKIAAIRGPQHIPRGIKSEKFRENHTFGVGGLYCFYYDPKFKNDLPYYDKFPLVLVLQTYDDGFLGLNLHYLPIRERAIFMDKLMDYAITKDDQIMKMRVTYEILKVTTRLKAYKPCVKKYLTTHLRSKILKVQPDEWEVAVFLPMHQFAKQKAQAVWQDSLDAI
jgi:hypothetical protein